MFRLTLNGVELETPIVTIGTTRGAAAFRMLSMVADVFDMGDDADFWYALQHIVAGIDDVFVEDDPATSYRLTREPNAPDTATEPTIRGNQSINGRIFEFGFDGTSWWGWFNDRLAPLIVAPSKQLLLSRAGRQSR